ncbi:MAG TPA: DUF488 family protein [Blastocatellia bacterium]|nr:DUF488 family protein [Blastocatellia bacterium]
MQLKLRAYRIGSPRVRGEGLRIGTVRLLPRGVKKTEYASQGYFDVWFPTVAPSRKLLDWIHRQGRDKWSLFCHRYEREMKAGTDSRQAVKLLAELAKISPIAVGCYCEDEAYCHRTVLVKLIKDASSNPAWPD